MNQQRKISVRLAIQRDLNAVAILWRESAMAMDGLAGEVPSLDAMRQRIDAELNSGWQLHVAVLGSRLVGMIAIKPQEAWLDQIFVAPKEQGKGVGKMMLHMAKRAMPDGFQLRMAASNCKAARFYEREDMESLGTGVHPRTGDPVIFYGWKVR